MALKQLTDADGTLDFAKPGVINAVLAEKRKQRPRPSDSIVDASTIIHTAIFSFAFMVSYSFAFAVVRIVTRQKVVNGSSPAGDVLVPLRDLSPLIPAMEWILPGMLALIVTLGAFRIRENI